MATKKESEQQKSSSKKGSEETNASKSNANSSISETNASSQIDELLQVLQSDLSTIDAESALSSIDQWHSFLSKTKDSDLTELADCLKDLQKVLKSGKANRHTIGDALIHIGEQTSELALTGDKSAKQSVQKLGKQLRKAGTSLAQAEEQEYHQQLDNLLAKSEEGELTSLEAKEATSTIDFWYNILHNVEDEKIKSISTGLKSLKQALGKSNSKPEAIAKALAEVGTQTREVAAQAPRGFKGIIQKLGRQLETASESLLEEA
jgi:F0F1-type ATP synthase membrane subunit b/b'